MRRLLKSDKRGLSIMIGYVLLVSMAIGLSVMVYNYIRHEIPSGKDLSCPDGVSFSLDNVFCDAANTNLTFDIKNSGMFGVDGYRVRVNDRDDSNIGTHELYDSSDDSTLPSGYRFKPGDVKHFSFDYNLDVTGGLYQSNLKLLEVQPYIISKGGSANWSYCDSVITELRCSHGPEVCGGGGDYDNDGLYDCDDPDCRFSLLCSEYDSSLMAHYTFDDTLNDQTLNNDGTYSSGDPNYVSGKIGNAVSLDGSGYISLDDSVSLSPSEGITMTAWVKLSSCVAGGPDCAVISSSDGYFLGVTNGNEHPVSRINTGSAWYSSTYDSLGIDDNNWYFIAGTYDGSNLITYVYSSDGSNTKKIKHYLGSINDPTTINIGSTDDQIHSPTNYFKGSIDDVRIYNYSMSSDEIQALYEYMGG